MTQLYSIWITDLEGNEGRWIVDSKRGNDHVWTGKESEALLHAEIRRRAHAQYKYEVKKYALKDEYNAKNDAA